jgi:dTDP-4-amino-4,6-dideoxygalactose transaminase
MRIPFSKPYLTGLETEYLKAVMEGSKLSGNGSFTKQCQAWLQNSIGSHRAFLTQSCTSALEMSGLLMGLKEGDEVIMPSFTFSSTAAAFVLRGAVPVFVDVRPDTLNIDECEIEAAITPRTKAIVPVHYAGVSCEMDRIMDLARHYQLLVTADAAQAVQSLYKGTPVGAFGDLSTFSFHDTKNISCGEGGALLINNAGLSERAEILWEKGTNRIQFLRGDVNKYSWVDVGSSFLPSELTASFLYAQLSRAREITAMRMQIWIEYYQEMAELEARGLLRRPIVPADCTHNAHIFYVLHDQRFSRHECLAYLAARGIQATFHYVPLHSSPAGRKFGRTVGELPVTDLISDHLLRLPLWPGLTEAAHVSSAIREFCLKANDNIPKGARVSTQIDPPYDDVSPAASPASFGGLGLG